MTAQPLYRGQGNVPFQTAHSVSAAKRGQVVPYDVNGAPSASPDEILAVSDVAVAAGMPLAVNRSTGHIVKADASSKPVAFIAGLASVPTSIGFPASVASDWLMLPDWTAITGSVSLSQGQTYFLGAGGGLTTTPPSSPNCVTVVGEAVSTTTLLVRPEIPIQL